MKRKRKKRRNQRSNPYLGTPPGELVAAPTAAEPTVRVIAYDESNLVEEEVTDISALAEYRQKWTVTWVNVDGLGDADVVRRIGEVFGLHPLALADALHLVQRPKVEDYSDHVFFIMRMVEDGTPLTTEQVSMFLGDGFVVTFQEHPGDCLDPVRTRLRRKQGRVRTMKADYLAYCVIDAVIDAYFPCLDRFSDAVETLEEEVLDEPTPDTVARIHGARRDLLTVRRVMSSSREAVGTLFRTENRFFEDTTLLYMRDCYDHVIQVLDMTENHREIVSGLLDVYLSSVSNRMNEVMKVLTMIATIFIPLSFLAGVYGMNFDPDSSPWNMPELDWPWAYPVVLLLMLLIGVAELAFFRQKGWLGGTHAKKRNQGK